MTTRVVGLRALEVVRRPLRASLGRDRAPPVPWVAVALSGSIVVTALVTGAYGREIPAELGLRWSTGWPALVAGRWWTLGTSFVLTRDRFMAATMPICLAVSLGLYERRAGHARALAVALVGHAVGTVVLAVAFSPLAWTGVPTLVKAADNLDYGGSMAIAAACGALASRVRDRRFTFLVVGIGVVALPVHHQMADWGHLVALPLGFVVDRSAIATAAIRAFLHDRVVLARRIAALVAMLAVPLVIGGLAADPRFHDATAWLYAYTPDRFLRGQVWTLPFSAMIAARPDRLGPDILVPVAIFSPFVLAFGAIRPLRAFFAGHIVATLTAGAVIVAGAAAGWHEASVLLHTVDAGASAGLAAAAGALAVALGRTRWRFLSVAVVVALVALFGRRLTVESPTRLLADAEHFVALVTGAAVEWRLRPRSMTAK